MYVNCWRKIKNIMKKFILLILGLGYFIISFGQSCEIPLQIAFMREVENMPHSSLNIMENKLHQIVSENGLSSISNNTMFAIVPRYDVIDKHIIAGPPQKTIYNLNITLNIINIYDKNVFATCVIEVDGVGNNETKAFIDGVKQLSANNKQIQSFLKQGKEKIILYYNNNYKQILAKADVLANQHKYEEALYYINYIPECCSGYSSAINEAKSIYKAYTDYQCNIALSKAQSIWVSEQNAISAKEATKYLSKIYPDANCYQNAMNLYNEIKTKINENLEFQMKKYNDNIDLESQRINSIKEIGVSYGENHKETSNNLLIIK